MKESIGRSIERKIDTTWHKMILPKRIFWNNYFCKSYELFHTEFLEKVVLSLRFEGAESLQNSEQIFSDKLSWDNDFRTTFVSESRERVWSYWSAAPILNSDSDFKKQFLPSQSKPKSCQLSCMKGAMQQILRREHAVEKVPIMDSSFSEWENLEAELGPFEAIVWILSQFRVHTKGVMQQHAPEKGS